MLPKHNKGSNNMGKHLLQHESLTEPASVPSTVSWVGTGGGGVVTDQAVCGSCWAFATAAALQGALWMKTGILQHCLPFLQDCKVQSGQVRSWFTNLLLACWWYSMTTHMLDLPRIWPVLSWCMISSCVVCTSNGTRHQKCTRIIITCLLCAGHDAVLAAQHSGSYRRLDSD